METARDIEMTTGALPGVLRDQLEKAGESTQLISEVGRWFHLPSPDLLPLLLDTLLERSSAERIFLIAKATEAEPECLLARNLDQENIKQPLTKVIFPLIERVISQNKPWQCMDVPLLSDRDRWDRENIPRTKSLLVLPLGSDTVLYLDHRFQTLPSQLENDLLVSIATAAIQNIVQPSARPTGMKSDRSEKSTPGKVPVVRSDFASESTAEIIGEHVELQSAKKLIQKVAASQVPVLVTGESGTGKELAARSVHDRSDRASGPFVSENCGAITETLLETELFGCVKGAYTGATENRPGLFEFAHGGTIFLDEIGDTSPGLQKKLLRVIQEGVIRRVGGQEQIKIDVRIVSATNRDLTTEVREGRFREDLFYRLNVINVHLPPLRDRGDDVILLAEHFLSDLNQVSGSEYTLNEGVREHLLRNEWPGNIRQLQNEMRRVHALAIEHLDATDFSAIGESSAGNKTSNTSVDLEAVKSAGSMKAMIEELEKRWISEALERFDGHRGDVCQSLGIPKTTLYAKMKRYGISTENSD